MNPFAGLMQGRIRSSNGMILLVFFVLLLIGPLNVCADGIIDVEGESINQRFRYSQYLKKHLDAFDAEMTDQGNNKTYWMTEKCMAFLEGLKIMSKTMASTPGVVLPFSIPDDISPQELNRVLREYMEKHPDTTASSS